MGIRPSSARRGRTLRAASSIAIDNHRSISFLRLGGVWAGDMAGRSGRETAPCSISPELVCLFYASLVPGPPRACRTERLHAQAPLLVPAAQNVRPAASPTAVDAHSLR